MGLQDHIQCDAQYSVQEAADLLGASTRSVHNWREAGDFPNASKLNPNRRTSPWRIPGSDLLAFLEARRNGSPGSRDERDLA